MAKAHSKVKFDKSFPFGGFWRDNWLITKMTQVLESRVDLTPEEDHIRVIVVKDEYQNTLFLQGEEVDLVERLCEFCVNHSDQDNALASKILDKIRETGTPV